MALLYLDLVGGISGDMTVAALLELGVPLEALREGVRQVGLDGVTLDTEPAVRHQLAGTRFLVRDIHGAPPDQGHTHTHSHAEGQAHSHSHGSHGHSHSHSDTHVHHHGGGGHPHRAYRDIRRMLADSGLTPGAKERAQAVFARLAEAEGAVHGVAAEEVSFHEVGAWDSIADIVCASVALDLLAPEAIYCSRVPVGSGMVATAHGQMPIPTPATLLLLKGFPVLQGGPAYERTTPTGAAILAALAKPAPEPFLYTPGEVGIGVGGKDAPEVPNILRAVMGQAGGIPGATIDSEVIECSEANLDDSNPEWIGYLMEQLLAAGALDVALVPIHMKKNRPGTQIQVLHRPELRAAVHGLLFSEATTLGVRYRALQRVALPREHATVETLWGVVSGVVARHGDTARFSPEFESCRKVAESAQRPLRDVYLAAQQAWAAHKQNSAD